ncbi:MAG: ABC transporter ATP-binding protein, partial [Firmicutes bacterium]|nr:ABC transporter ATP-binding protein [Bacillota bacterium]
MSVLAVSNLCKRYNQFQLDNVSFVLEQGTITGFIGRNGAGKTTTLKALLNFVHPDDGEILFFGKSFKANEFEIKQKIGFVAGGINYYPKKKIKTITATTRRFYANWDEQAYQHYMERFALDENKTPDELSAGMKVKYALVLALSHHAELLILDEPT